MNQLIPQATLEYLKSVELSPEICRKVLRLLIKNEKVSDQTEAEILLVFQILLASNYSLNKISEILNLLKFPEAFVSDFVQSFVNVPKVRAGVVLPRLVDVNWKTVHEVNTSNVRKLHAPAIMVQPVVQDLEGNFESFKFTCTRAQLAELVYKLKSAIQQIEKIY